MKKRTDCVFFFTADSDKMDWKHIFFQSKNANVSVNTANKSKIIQIFFIKANKNLPIG